MGSKIAVFDADAEVRQLLTTDQIKSKLERSFGAEVFASEGEVDRSALRELVFADAGKRKLLEEIIHPSVLLRCQEFGANLEEREPAPVLAVYEIPLLYESDFPVPRDADLVVGASKAVQVRRLTEYRGLDANMAEKIIDAQMPMTEKMQRADFVLWNDGAESELHEQITLFLDAIGG